MNLNDWKEKLFQRYLIWSCRPARINRYLSQILTPKLSPEPADRRRVRAAALQVKLELCKNPFDFANLVHRRVKEADQEGARLVVFPEYLNLLLLGLLPGIEQFEKEYSTDLEDHGSGSDQGNGDQVSIPDLFRFMTPAVLPLVTTVFSKIAAAYHLYIMAGSYTVADKESMVNRAFCFGPQGEIIGIQDKAHLLMLEEEWQLKRGKNFEIIDTAIGRLAMPICMDATYYESFRLLEENGVEIAMLPIANPEAYNYWLALRGIWPRVQESPLYGVKSALVGSISGFNFTGRAGIFAPLDLTPRRDGVLAEVEDFDREAMVAADLDLDALLEWRRNHPWRDRNPELYRRYFPDVYQAHD